MQKFSIILPVRNGGEYVKECVRNILAQTFPDFNLIVLDSFSSDGTPEWIESLHNDKIVIHKSTENLTIEENWGRIRNVSKNEYMTMIGHDDLLQPNYLTVMNGLIADQPNASLYQTHFKYIDERGDFLRDCIPMVKKQTAAEFLASQMQREIDSTGTGYMMRSRDFDELGGIPLKYPNLIFADFQLWVSLMLRGYKVTSEKECFSYRIHQSVSHVTNGMFYQHAFSIYIDYLIGLANQYMDIKAVIEKYGKDFLLNYCEALSHRLLKTPIGQRSMLVADFIAKCKSIATRFIPGQEFEPEKKIKIWLAELIDKTKVGRSLFQAVKKINY